MVQVTPQAVRHLTETRNQRGFSRKAGVRFVPHGHAVGLTFSGKPKPGDSVSMASDLPVYIAPEVAEKLHESTIDVVETDGKMRVYLRPSRTAASAP
jgi:Fe-S cluster assembly iron-binding protein IscA